MTIRCLFCVVLLLSAGEAAAQEGQAVSALGRLEPEHGTIRVSASSTPQAVSGAVLTELRVEEGDDVAAGQLLAVTSTAQVMEAMVREAEASLAQAIQEVDAARSQSVEACVRADVAAQEAERRTRLHAQGVAGEEEAESARGEAEARKAACASASAQVRLAEAGIRVARAHLDRVKAEAQRSFIHAPTDGRVLEVIVRPGELIREAGILELGRVSRMFAVAEVFETDILRVRPGQRATISSGALANDLEGTVRQVRQKVQKQDEIGTDPAARKDARIIEVRIELDDPAAAASLTNLQVDVLIHP